MCNEYSGWTNKPTWSVALWLGNDNDWHNMFVNRAYALSAKGGVGREQLAGEIQDFVHRMFPCVENSSLPSDMLGWLFAITDWLEVADGYLATAEDWEAHGETMEEGVR